MSSSNRKKIKKKNTQKKFNLIPHLQIRKNSKAYTKALQVATKKTPNGNANTMTFFVSELEDAIDYIQKERGVYIQLNNITIPAQLNTDLYEAVQDSLFDIMYKEYVDPYHIEIHNVLAAHGENWETKLQQVGVHHPGIILDQNDDDIWTYKRFHYAFKPTIEELEQKEDMNCAYKIYFMSPPELPHFRTYIIEYKKTFELPSIKLFSTEVIIKVLQEKIHVSLEPSPTECHTFVVNKYEQVHILENLQFAFKIPVHGATVEFTFLNNEVTGLSPRALELKKEASIVDLSLV